MRMMFGFVAADRNSAEMMSQHNARARRNMQASLPEFVIVNWVGLLDINRWRGENQPQP